MNNKENLKKFISTQGYKKDSPDKNRPMNVIPSNNITMKDVEFPVYGMDNTGHSRMMYPGEEHVFPGDFVVEHPMMQNGGPVQLTPIQEYYAEQMYQKYGKVVLTDKGTNRTIYGTKKPDGTWDLNSFEVLTGAAGIDIFNQGNNYVNASDDYAPTNQKVTPVGTFPLKYSGNLYNEPGYFLEGANGVANHTTYKGPDDPNRSALFYNGNNDDNYRSYGCINCEKPDIQNLTKFLGSTPDVPQTIIDSRLTAEQNEKYMKKNSPPSSFIPYTGVKGKGPDIDTDQNKFDENLYIIQQDLNNKGANITVDGLYGPETEKAMREFGTKPFIRPNFSYLKSQGIKAEPVAIPSEIKQIKEENTPHDQPLIYVPDVLGSLVTPTDNISKGDPFVMNDNVRNNVVTSTKTNVTKKEPSVEVSDNNVIEKTSVVDNKPTVKKTGLVKGGTEAVQKYQKMLNDKYNAGISEDGAWGKNTQAAYEKYVLNKKITKHQDGGFTTTSHMLSDLPDNNFNKGLMFANSLGSPNSMLWALPNQGFFGKMKGIMGAAAGLSGAALGYEKLFTSKNNDPGWDKPEMMQIDPRLEKQQYDFQPVDPNREVIAEYGGELPMMQFGDIVPKSPVILPQQKQQPIPFKQWYIQNAVRLQGLSQEKAYEQWKLETGQQITPATTTPGITNNNSSSSSVTSTFDDKSKTKNYTTYGDSYGMVAGYNAIAGLGMLNQVLDVQDNQKKYNKMLQELGTTDNRYVTMTPQNPFGNYTLNAGSGSNFQLVTNTPAQDFGTRMFKEGGEYMLTDEEIEYIKRNGGTIEFID